MLEQWIVLPGVIIGPLELHPAVHKLIVLVEAAEEVSARLRVQVHQQPYIPEALIRLVQKEFNKSFQKVFMIPLPICWPHFALVVRTLTTGDFQVNSISMPGGFKYHKPPPQQTRHQKQGNLPPPVAPQTTDPSRLIGATTVQVQEHNPAPNPQL